MKFLLIFFLLVNIVIAKDYSEHQIEARIKKINGDTTEYLMHKTFKQNGWKQIQGEIGGNGIDGLYIKTNSKGTVTNVMFGEAKYNTSSLGTNYYGTDTKNVKQMSKTALSNQIDNLIKKYPNNKQYVQIKRHIENGNYRARIFQLKKDGDFLIPQIKAINNNGEINVEKTKLIGNQNYKINNMKIDINNPKNNFEARFIENYKRGQRIGLMRKFNFSAIKSQLIVDKTPILSSQSISQQLNKIDTLNSQVSNTFRTNVVKLNSRNFTGKHLKIKTKTFWKKISLKTIKILRKVK